MFKNLFFFVFDVKFFVPQHQKRNDFPIALDEEIAREELNAPQEFEEIEFNEEEED